MSIYETDLPGVGKKYEIDLDKGKRLVIVTHNTGKREVYMKADEDADGEKLFEVSDRLARTVGTILEGAYFQPVSNNRVETMLSEGKFIEWYNAAQDAELVGQSLEGANVRGRTGASVIAIQRQNEISAPPDPDMVVRSGDTIVAVGDQESCRALESLLDNQDQDR